MEIDAPRMLPDQATSFENMWMLGTIRPSKPAGECGAAPCDTGKERQKTPKSAARPCNTAKER